MTTYTRTSIDGIAPDPANLLILDGARRLYAGLNRACDSWHVIQPARANDQRVIDGKVAADDLVCTCEAGMFHGYCYRVKQAEALEARRPAAPVTEDVFAR